MTGVQTCARSEEHTSELQSHDNLVCRLLLEKKKNAPAGERHRRRLTTPQRARDARAPRPGLQRVRPRPVLLVREVDLQHGVLVFFFNDPAPPEIYTLPLPDALPINDTATTEIYTLSLHDAFRSRWSPYH